MSDVLRCGADVAGPQTTLWVALEQIVRRRQRADGCRLEVPGIVRMWA